jgi:hypothetical protein
MKDPLEQMFSYDYRVTGAWSDPVVARVGARAQQAAPAEAGVPMAQPATPAPPAAPTVGATK